MSNAVTVPTILIDGEALAPGFAPIEIDVAQMANRIPVATISIQALGGQPGEAPLMAGGPFAPASEVEIKLRQGSGDDVSLLKGLVTALGVRTRNGLPTLEVVIKDKAIGLTGARHSRVWTDMADSDAIRSIVEAASLTMGDAPDTEPAHKSLVQYDSTDWDFILARADAQGLAVVVRDGTLSLKKLALDDASAYTFSLGLDPITDVAFDLDVTTQAATLSGVVWDPDQLAAASPADASALALPQGDIGSDSVGDALGIGPVQLVHMAPLPAAEAKAWATARMARARLALIRGRISVSDLSKAQPMDIATLKGFGDRLNGDALITGVRHRLDSRGLSADLQFGLSPEPAGRLPDLVNMQAGGLLPPISGLQLGTVNDAEDPDNQGRVQVTVPAVGTDAAGPLWARVAVPDAGDKRGFCFRPEAGDEVLVGFLASDPRYPVVLGRLHGGKNKLPGGFTDAKQKGIVTKRDARLVFSEADKPSITISTPGGRTVILDDEKKTITLSDQDKNMITLDADGITINAAKNLTLKASGAVKVSGSTIDLN